MTITKLNNALKASPSGRLMGLLFFFLTQITLAQLNSDKQTYDLNDPRNPDCPCHKYQKMAEEEFNKIPKENKFNQAGVPVDITGIKYLNNKNTQLKENKHLSGSSTADFSKNQKRRKLTWRKHKILHFFTLKPSKTRKFKPNYYVCYKW